MLIALFNGAGSADGEYTFGWGQKIGVVIGCAVIWLGCIVLSGWRPRSPVYVDTANAVRDTLRNASGSTWFDLSQTRTVRRLGVVQTMVMLATALCLLTFTSARWYVALLVALFVSIGLNLAISRVTGSALRRERGRRSRD